MPRRRCDGPLLMGKGFGAVKKPAFTYTGKLSPGTLGPALEVPAHIGRPDYAADGVPKGPPRGLAWDIVPQTPDDIARMRVAGRIAREVLDEAVRFVKAGVTTAGASPSPQRSAAGCCNALPPPHRPLCSLPDIDRLVHAETVNRDAYPSPLNYHGFPKSCCTSINVRPPPLPTDQPASPPPRTHRCALARLSLPAPAPASAVARLTRIT